MRLRELSHHQTAEETIFKVRLRHDMRNCSEPMAMNGWTSLHAHFYFYNLHIRLVSVPNLHIGPYIHDDFLSSAFSFLNGDITLYYFVGPWRSLATSTKPWSRTCSPHGKVADTLAWATGFLLQCFMHVGWQLRPIVYMCGISSDFG